MKKIFILLMISIYSLLLATPASARSGCCSHHDGVRADGCGCNDGTPLSDTCAPYYTCNAPQQNTATVNTYTAPVYVAPTVTPTLIPTDSPTPTLTPTPTPKPHKTVVKKNTKKKVSKPNSTPSKSLWQWLFGK